MNTAHGIKAALALVTITIAVSCSGKTREPAENASTTSHRDVPALAQSLTGLRVRFMILNDESGDWPYFSAPTAHAIYGRGEENASDTKRLLVDPAVSTEIKVLAARFSQCMSVQSLLGLIGYVSEEVKAGRVDPAVLRALVSPGAEWGTQLYLNHGDASVVRVLSSIASDPATDDQLKEAIDSILSGDQADYVRAYDQPNEPLPRMPCALREGTGLH